MPFVVKSPRKRLTVGSQGVAETQARAWARRDGSASVATSSGRVIYRCKSVGGEAIQCAIGSAPLSGARRRRRRRSRRK